MVEGLLANAVGLLVEDMGGICSGQVPRYLVVFLITVHLDQLAIYPCKPVTFVPLGSSKASGTSFSEMHRNQLEITLLCMRQMLFKFGAKKPDCTSVRPLPCC